MERIHSSPTVFDLEKRVEFLGAARMRDESFQRVVKVWGSVEVAAEEHEYDGEMLFVERNAKCMPLANTQDQSHPLVPYVLSIRLVPTFYIIIIIYGVPDRSELYISWQRKILLFRTPNLPIPKQ